MARFANLCCVGSAVLSAKGSAPVAKGLCSLPVVLMDEAAEAIAAHDGAVGVDVPDWWTALGYPKIEPAVWPLLVVVIDVGLQHRLEMTFAHDEDPVEALGANSPDKALRVGVGSGGAPRSANDVHTFGFEDLIEDCTESLVSIVRGIATVWTWILDPQRDSGRSGCTSECSLPHR